MFRLGLVCSLPSSLVATQTANLEREVAMKYAQVRMQTGKALKAKGIPNSAAVVKHHGIASRAAAELRAFRRAHRS